MAPSYLFVNVCQSKVVLSEVCVCSLLDYEGCLPVFDNLVKGA